eukprot:SAG11_NODE_1046_length_6042_cov_12.954400_3_plen_68_part_00
MQSCQNIKDDFAAKCYETHARLALENSDYTNYKQCSATLAGYYAKGVESSSIEFTAYSVLYSVCTNV